ncbi:MAG: O-phospho-L-seryl-tRNA:Cys-tRNA synthase [Halobacteriota archaeon]
MDEQINKKYLANKIFETQFALEDLREIVRQALPTGMSDEQSARFSEIVSGLGGLIDEIGAKDGQTQPVSIVGDLMCRTREEEFINIQPIQAGGRLTPEARKAVIAYGDGYSTCDNCRKPFRLDKIEKPSIAEFHTELAEFVGMDQARVVPGARRGFQAVASTLVEKGDSVVVSAFAHYTEFLAVEGAGGVVREAPVNEDNILTAESVAHKIDEVKKETGKLPSLIMIDHFDYLFCNEHDIRGIGKVAKEYGIPFLYNGAYTVGIMPVDGKKIGADFVVGSGHKSMASVAPSGVLATTEEWADKIFRTTQMVGDVTGRKFGIKEVEFLGCTLMGAPLLSMMASFPYVKERTKHWDEEVKKSNYFLNEFLRIEGNEVLSEYPRKHALTKVDTTNSFDKVAKTHKRRGYFFSDELKKLGIAGEFPGATRSWKLSTYGLSWEQIHYLSDAFLEIAEKYELKIN